MSMINRMLSDLERRGAPRPKAGDAELVPERTPPAGRGPVLRRWFPVVLAGILVVLAAALWIERGDRMWALWRSGHATERPVPTGEARTAANEDNRAGETAAPAGSVAEAESSAEAGSRPPPVAASPPESAAVASSGAKPGTVGDSGAAEADGGSPEAGDAPEAGEAVARDDTEPAPTVGELQAKAEPARASEPRVRKSASLSVEARARRRYREGREALENGRLAEARRLLTDALTLDPSLHPARDLLVSIMRRAGDRDAARRLLDEGVERAPRRLEYAMPYARLLVDTGELERAANVLARARASGDGNAGFHALTAAVAQRRGLHEQAAQAYTRALEIDADNGLWWLGLGVSLAATERPQQARIALREARASGDLGDNLDRWAGRRIEELGEEG